MGMFFDKVLDSPAVNVLTEAYQEQPPANDADRDQRMLQLLDQLPMVQQMRTALDASPASAEDAHAKAAASSAALASVAPGATKKFYPVRFIVAVIMFGALVGAGAGTDAAHLTASSAAFFGFAGGVFGVVTAFLGAEKDS
jgi:hypothetical protein